ncbi:MAG: cation:proton antiporter [Gammaproteobacteria bacterium]|nr:cation:proton antiporter [Gammaproteobacteria bacterium]
MEIHSYAERRGAVFLIGLMVCTTPMVVFANDAGGYGGPISSTLMGLAIIMLGAILIGELFRRFGQPAVLGELMAGALIGNLGAHLGWDLMILLREGSLIANMAHEALLGTTNWEEVAGRWMSDAPQRHTKEALVLMESHHGHTLFFTSVVLDTFSRIGVILLLFMVGLETSLSELRHVGKRSTRVALFGVLFPFGLGYAASALLLQNLMSLGDNAWQIHLFIGATLSATSVGISARVFKDLGALQRLEAKIILGAAVIDDIIGLMLLAVVLGFVSTTVTSIGSEAFSIISKSLLYVIITLFLGTRLSPQITRFMSCIKNAPTKLSVILIFCFSMAWLAEFIGLAPMVGAFAAGLILEGRHFQPGHEGGWSIERLIEPVAYLFIPIFFVIMGIQLKVEALLSSPNIWLLILVFTVVACLGKQLCGLGAGKDADGWLVGLGMVPRGEVGLIFIAMGAQIGVFQDQLVSIMVVVVILTTVMTPPLLARRIRA